MPLKNDDRSSLSNPNEEDTWPVFSEKKGKNDEDVRSWINAGDDEGSSTQSAEEESKTDVNVISQNNEELIQLLDAQHDQLMNEMQQLKTQMMALSQPKVQESEQKFDFNALLSLMKSSDAKISSLIGKIGQLNSGEETLKEVKETLILLEKKYGLVESKLNQTLRENADFQTQVRNNMQKELEGYQKEILGERINPLLKRVAEIYNEYGYLKNADIDKKTLNNLEGMFLDLEDFLIEYGCEVSHTEVGQLRSLRSSKIRKTEKTGIKELHNTIKESHNNYVMRGKQVLYPEYVTVYVFDASLEVKEESTEELEENKKDDLTTAIETVLNEQETSVND